MALKQGDIVLVDTNVIIEAHRTNCWNQLAGYFSFETESECLAECETGRQSRKAPVRIDTDELKRRITIHSLDHKQILDFRMRFGAFLDLDAGEERLIAHALTREDAWLLCSPDAAAVRACHKLGMIDRVVAMEDLTKASGIQVELRNNYTCRWMSDFRTKILLDM